jgi:hypothetical protein
MIWCVQWGRWFVSRKELSARGRLDLAHGRSLLDATGTTAHVDARVTALETREDSRDGKGSEAEPEEGSGGLGLVAALGGVGRAVGDGIAVGVRLMTY